MNNPNPYHAFLIRHRVYCEHASQHQSFCLRHGATVENINGRDTVLCHEHSGRLDAARKSDARQFSETRDETPNLTT